MGYSNPANAAMPYFNQVPGTISPYYQKYIDAGGDSLNTLLGQYHTLLSDPGQVMNMAGSGFQQSPGYQFEYNQGMNAANSAAAAGGMVGTPYHQQNAAAMSSNLANQDYYNYLDHTLNLYDKGLSGEQDINHMGYQASDALASGLATNLNNEAGLAYQGQVNQNQHDADFWNSIISGGSAIAGGVLGGMVAGPVGATAGASAGSALGGMMSPNGGGGGNGSLSMQGYGNNGGMVGPGGTQQNAWQMIGQKIAQLFHGNGNGGGTNSQFIGGDY